MLSSRSITIATAACGAVVLAWSLRTEPGSSAFYVASLLLAVIWTGGAFLAGRLPWRGDSWRTTVAWGCGAGVGLSAIFSLGALIARELTFAAGPIEDVLAYANRGSLLAVLAVALAAGFGEELYFRGALFDQVGRHRLAITTAAYTVVTLVTGNLMLTLAAALVGLVAGMVRLRTGSVSAAVLTHLTWSIAMIAFLPLLF